MIVIHRFPLVKAAMNALRICKMRNDVSKTPSISYFSTAQVRSEYLLSDIISGKAVSQEQPARPGNKRARSECWVPLLTNRPPLAAAAVATGWPPILAAAVAASAAILPAVAAPDPAASLRASRLTAVAISGID